MTVSKLLSESFTDFIKHIFVRQISSFLIIFGRRGTGKTDFSLFIAEILDYLGLIQHVGTNVKILDSSFPIERITNLQDLKDWAKLEQGKKLFIFDEVGRSLPRRSPMSRLNLKLINEFQILRKYKLSIIACTPNEKYVDTNALGSDILDGVFTKPKFNNPKVALYSDFIENYDKALYDIPRTSIKFDTWDSAIFTEYPDKRVMFSDRDKQVLWLWCNKHTAKEIGLDRTQIRRILLKFVKTTLEKERDK